MRIEIDDGNKQAMAAILEALTSQESAQTLPPGVAVAPQAEGELSSAKTGGLPEALQIALSLGSGVAINIISNWLYDLLKRHKVALKINGKRTHIDPSSIERALQHTAERPDASQ